MAFRLIAAVWALVAIGAMALAIRQQRLATAHAISECHNAIDRDRLETRTLMTPISAKTSPGEIAAACRRAKLQLEPVEPQGQVLPDPESKPDAKKPPAAGGRP